MVLYYMDAFHIDYFQRYGPKIAATGAFPFPIHVKAAGSDIEEDICCEEIACSHIFAIGRIIFGHAKIRWRARRAAFARAFLS